jgi:nicotinamide phosphoribosyltransferase
MKTKIKKFTPPAMLLCDFYKISHREQYPDGTELVYSTWTPRASRLEGVNHVVHFGAQKFIKEYLISYFDDNFFDRPEVEVVAEYTRYIKFALGVAKPDSSHISALHKLGYLPLHIRSLAEGTIVPLRCPTMTIHNTKPEFFWLTNYIETLMSCENWQESTSATIAYEYRKILNKFALETTGSTAGVEFQGHDFSMRGMGSLPAAIGSGMGHLLSFVGTDTVPAIPAAEHFYNANVEKELIGTSIPATEHSVMCANGKDEIEVYNRLITKVYPSGFISIVSDTWDFWNTVTTVLPQLKDKILVREGKVVIRPDSGCPVKIMCGDPDASTLAERKGLVEVLWDIFGGTVNDLGYKVLDSHIGAIYGDSITRDRATSICQLLKDKKFASTNAVFGIGSFTYQYNTRDTFGYAMKSTLCQVNGSEIMIYKDPKTDDGTKKSAKGGVRVYEEDGLIKYQDQLSLVETGINTLLRDVYVDGVLLIDENFSDIRARVLKNA